MRDGMEKVTVVLPARNCKKRLAACLRMWTAAGPAGEDGAAALSREAGSSKGPALIVVDDGSSDGTGRMVREKWPFVTLLTLPAYTGYAHAANVGLRLVRTDYAFLIRPDLQPGRTCLPALLRAMEDGRDLRTGGSRVFCAVPGRGPGSSRKPFETVAVPDGCALYRMRALEEVGWFDERHFDGLEAFDLSLRAALYGWQTLEVPGAAVRPREKGLRTDRFRRRLAAGNAPYVLYKNLPALQRLLDFPLLRAAEAAQAAGFLRRGEAGAYRMARTREKALRSLEEERRIALAGGAGICPESLADASFLGTDEALSRIYPLYLAQREPAMASRIRRYFHIQRLLVPALADRFFDRYF